MAFFVLCDMIITDADVVNSSHLDAVFFTSYFSQKVLTFLVKHFPPSLL